MNLNAISVPADVRAAGTDAVKNYKTAQGFEQMLVGQLVKEMVGTTGPLAEGPYASNLQDTLTGALVGGRGIGLAQQLYKEMQQS
jgi:Rod binding domain-containing protein